jgi:hypothetical protein
MQANCLEEGSMLVTGIRTIVLATMAVGTLAVVGCGGAGAQGPDGSEAATTAADACAVAGWCTEHGVPEDICAQCNPQVAARYKQKGDWCKEHHRPESQCFLCSPQLQAKFAAEYEVKYGQKPPQPEGT